MLKLRYKNNKHSAVWLVEPKVSLGRASSNDLVIEDSESADQHAEIIVSHEKLVLVNTSAGKPLFVNRRQVKDKAALKTNDVITIGKTQLQVIDPKQEPKVSPTVVRDEEATGWALKANHSALSNRVFAVKPVTVVGRSNECDITLAAAHLSRRHAKLEVKDGLLYVKDLESSNGTFLNGRKVTEARIKRGDDLRFDTLSFGVIGPSDDLDRTTVRNSPVSSAQSRTAKSNTEHRKPAKASLKQSSEDAPTMMGYNTGRVDHESLSEDKEPGKNMALFLIVGLIIAGAAGWAVLSSGLF